MEGEAQIVEELKKIVQVLENKQEYEEDWWVYSRIAGKTGSCIAAVRPLNEPQVLSVLRFCYDKDIPVTCRGGGSSVTGASVPERGIVIDMSGMRRIVRLDTENSFVEVEAGIRLNELESRLNEIDYTLGQFPQSFELATVGGYISTMGTGEFSSLYGGIENSCLSLRIALPDGEVIETRYTDSPRSSAGPNLTHLFIGAEGMLGVILAAKLKIYRKERYSRKLAYTLSRFEDSGIIARELLNLDIRPALFRAYNSEESMFLFGIDKPVLLLVYNFKSEGVMNEIMNEVKSAVSKHGGREESETLVDRYLYARYRFREQLEFFSKANIVVETAEVAAVWSRLFRLYQDVASQVKKVKGVSAVGAHISHIYEQGACIYFTVLFEPSRETYGLIWEAVDKACSNYSATVSHHHGVGILKKDMVKREMPLSLLLKIKDAIDVKGMMNPGKYLQH
ncbi:MAG: FAD-binding oxidoreductase [Conexivisphaerales archaeon]